MLMDCNMPILNGYDTCKFLKKKMGSGEIQKIKIVAVTADVTDHNKERCQKAGFDDFLSKPLTHPEIKRVLKKYIEEI